MYRELGILFRRYSLLRSLLVERRDKRRSLQISRLELLLRRWELLLFLRINCALFSKQESEYECDQYDRLRECRGEYG